VGWPLETRYSSLQFLLREKHKTACLGTKKRRGRKRGTYFVNGAQGGWYWHSALHREAQTMCLSRVKIGILPQDNHLDLDTSILAHYEARNGGGHTWFKGV